LTLELTKKNRPVPPQSGEKAGGTIGLERAIRRHGDFTREREKKPYGSSHKPQKRRTFLENLQDRGGGRGKGNLTPAKKREGEERPTENEQKKKTTLAD